MLAILLNAGGQACANEEQTKEPPGEAAGPIPIAEMKRDRPVDFMTEALPIFNKNCLACHSATEAKGDLVLETPATIIKGGGEGPAVVPGKSGGSLLLKLASRQMKPFMPPRNNKVNASALTPDELGLIKLWVDQGATGAVTVALGPVRWQPLPAGFNPINAVAVTADGQYAACGRANQVFIYHVPSGSLVTRLTDPELLKSGLVDKPGVADRDVIQSLAFSPDGTLLASGGYRVVKLWRRQPVVPKFYLSPVAGSPVAVVAASPNGKWLATPGAEHQIRIWDAANGKLSKELSGHTGTVTALLFSPDNDKLYSGSADKTLRLWRVSDGASLGRIETPSEIKAVTWAAEGKQLVAGGADQVIRTWSLPEGTNTQTNVLMELKGHSGPITSLDTLLPAGRQILSGSADGSVRLWNIDTGQPARQMDHGGPVTTVAARKDGKRLASAGLNNAVKLWNAENGQLVAELKGDRYAQEWAAELERGLAFAKNEVAYQKSALEKAQKQQQTESEAVAKATEAKTAAEKALAEKYEASAKATEAKAAADKAWGEAISELTKATAAKALAEKEAPAAGAEAKAAEDTAVQVKSAFEKAAQAKAGAYQTALDLAAQAQKSAEKVTEAKTAAQKEPANKALADALAAAEKAATAKASEAEAAIDKAAASKLTLGPAALAKADAEQHAQEAAVKAKAAHEAKAAAEKAFTDATNWQKEAETKAKATEKQATEASQALKKAETEKSRADETLDFAVRAARKADELVTASKTAVESASAEQQKAEAVLATATKTAAATEMPVRAVAFSPDHQLLASAGDDKLIHTWSAENGQAYDVFKGPAAAALALAFLADGSLVSSAADQQTGVWHATAQWTLERAIGTGDDASPLADRVLALDFSTDGRWLATGGGIPSRSGELKVWQVADGALVREFKEAHSDTVFGLDFTADGKYLASCAADKFIKVFDAASGNLIKTFEGHTHHVLGVSWKRDGRTLASCGADKAVKIWDFIAGEQRKTLDGFNQAVTSIHFAGIGNEALITTGDSLVRFIREDGNLNVRNFAGGTDYLQCGAVTPEGRIVIAGGQDSVLRVWNGTNGERIGFIDPPKADGPARLLTGGREAR